MQEEHVRQREVYMDIDEFIIQYEHRNKEYMQEQMEYLDGELQED